MTCIETFLYYSPIMCGLWAYLLRHGNLFDATQYTRHEPWKHANANRGPDRMTEVQGADYHMVFHRLSINDLTWHGDQPFQYEWGDGTMVHVMCNGEIYNYKQLIDTYNLRAKLRSSSDCEVIGHLIEHFQGDQVKVARALRGEFAFVARIEHPNGVVRVIAARDTFGVRPMYYGSIEKGIIFSSLLAGVVGFSPDAKGYHFPPGHAYSETLTQADENDGVFTPFSHVSPQPPYAIDDSETEDKRLLAIYRRITDALIEAVRVRLEGEREFGFLLSGGLDSSLVVAIATKIIGIKNPRTFCIGFDKDATDIKFARLVSQYLGTNHTELVLSPKEAVEEVRDVIRALETYDITTIRASVPQYILAKHISEKTDIKVIMNGDGSDEVSNGYIYNYYAPSAVEASKDAERLLREIHCFDGLRVDRTLGAHGLEARLPFLDPAFVAAYHSTEPELRVPSQQHGRIEKQLLRDAFDALYPGLLPKEILFRRKEAFSDGVTQASVTKSWFAVLQKEAKRHKKEETEWYKEVFDFYFPEHRHILPHYWLPPSDWVTATDPSARTLDAYSM